MTLTLEQIELLEAHAKASEMFVDGSRWIGSVNVDGLRVAGYEGQGKDNVISNTMHYAEQYFDESEKRVTITIQKGKDDECDVF